MKEFYQYLCEPTKAHADWEDYLKSPATAFLKYTIEAKSAIKFCIDKFPKNKDGNYSSDSLDSLQHLTVAILPSIMGHFETYQRILFARIFDFSIYLEKFSVEDFLKKLNKENSVAIDINRLAAYRNIETSSVGNIIADSLSGWHSPDKVNKHFEAFGLKRQLFGKNDIKQLKVLWQLRHSIVHTGGTLTLPDAQKVDELKEFGRKTIAFEKNFIGALVRKMHPLVQEATKRMKDGFMGTDNVNLISTINDNEKSKIETLFEVKSSVNVWLK